MTASLEEAGEWKAVPAESLKAGETLGPFRILTIDTSSPRTLVLLLSPEDLGSLEIPSFDLAFRGPGGEEKKLVVPASHVTVASIIGEGDSTALSDLKPPAELPIPWPWRTIGLVAVLAAALAAAVYGAARWFARPRAATPMPEEALPPGMTPDVWARGELARILASGLREAGRYRELHIELADLARRYIELRFRIPALERTTSEIGYEMRLALIEEEVTLLTTALLARCDRVKFAKYVPQGAEVDETVELAGRIIERTVAHETLSPPAGSVSSEPAGTPAVGPA